LNIFLYILIGAFAIQMSYYLLLYTRLLFHKEIPLPPDQELPPVTVIVCARSEAKNLMELVPILFKQDYPQYEILVINDRSWDDSLDILEALKIKYPTLRFITIEENERHHFSGKKMAVTLGIKGATHEHLIFTDADCRPLHNNWLRHMAKGFGGKSGSPKTIVLGYSPYKRRKGMLNWFIRFDTYAIAMNYMAMAKAGMPYMGVGRNMAYTRKQHFEKGGFRSHYHIASGDDDLFVNENATGANTAVILHPESHVSSIPKTTFEEWKRQKVRHMSTARHYQFKHKLLLGIYSFSLLVFYVSLPLAIFLNKALFISLTFFGIRLLAQIITFRGSSKWLGNKDVALFSTFLEIFLLLIQAWFYALSMFAKKNKWT
jgi:cellulose synthase/poly-beta-1,6-N-acetylglucosamine synthase-like glycosyltransferase